VSTDELAAEIVGRCRERIDAGEDVDVDAARDLERDLSVLPRDESSIPCGTPPARRDDFHGLLSRG